MLNRIAPELWVIFHFGVLPTDPRFQALTYEQILGLYHAHVAAIKRAAGQKEDEEYVDADYDRFDAECQKPVTAKRQETVNEWPADEPLDLSDTAKWRDVP